MLQTVEHEMDDTNLLGQLPHAPLPAHKQEHKFNVWPLPTSTCDSVDNVIMKRSSGGYRSEPKAYFGGQNTAT